MTASNALARFELGRLLSTPLAVERLAAEDVHRCLLRHQAGDWGDLCDQDKQENQRALVEGSRLFSAYTDRGDTRFWIITEADRSATTVLLPEEY